MDNLSPEKCCLNLSHYGKDIGLNRMYTTYYPSSPMFKVAK